VLAIGSLAVAVPAEVVQAFVVWRVLSGAPEPVGPTTSAETLADVAARLTTVGAVVVVTAWVVWVAVSGLAASVRERMIAGEPADWATIGPLLRRSAGPLALAVLLATAGAAALAGLAVGPALLSLNGSGAVTIGWLVIGVTFAVVVAAALGPRLATAPSVIVRESVGAVAGIRRSWRLTHGHFWRVMAVLVLNAVLTHAVTAVLAAPLAAFSSEPDPADLLADGRLLLLSGLAGALAVAVTAPFTGSLLAVLYDELRRQQRQ
jgi:hypothetical protein